MKVGTDATLLGAWTKTGNAGHILEVGTGCGLIALMLAQKSKAGINAIDIDRDSASEAAYNFRQSPWKERVVAEHISLQDLANQSEKHFDLIISNPPFFSDSLKNTDLKKARARHDEKLTLREFFFHGTHLLNMQGKISLIIPSVARSKAIELAGENGLFPTRLTTIHPHPGKPANRVMLEFKFDQQELSTSRFNIRNSNGEYTQAYIKLLKPYLLYL